MYCHLIITVTIQGNSRKPGKSHLKTLNSQSQMNLQIEEKCIYCLAPQAQPPSPASSYPPRRAGTQPKALSHSEHKTKKFLKLGEFHYSNCQLKIITSAYNSSINNLFQNPTQDKASYPFMNMKSYK